MRILSRLFRMFKGGGRSAGRRGTSRHGGLGTTTRGRGGIGSMIRRFLR